MISIIENVHGQTCAQNSMMDKWVSDTRRGEADPNNWPSVDHFQTSLHREGGSGDLSGGDVDPYME